MNSGDHEAQSGRHSLKKSGAEYAVNERAHRAARDVGQGDCLRRRRFSDRDAQSVRYGLAVAIKEEHREKAQNYLNHSAT
jgi:hypothetical protein